MSLYAAQTSVSEEASIEEIRQTLARYGADRVRVSYGGEQASIGFRAHSREVRLELTLPTREECRRAPSGYRRTPAEWERAYEQAHRQCWRALALVVKAKLEAVAVGIGAFDQEFLSSIVLADDRTIGEVMVPQLGRVLALPSP